MLQPEPRSGEGCNTLLPEGLANVNARGNWQTLMHVEKNVISSLLYTFPSAHAQFIYLFIQNFISCVKEK